MCVYLYVCGCGPVVGCALQTDMSLPSPKVPATVADNTYVPANHMSTTKLCLSGHHQPPNNSKRCAPVTAPPPSSVAPQLWAASLADLDAAREEVEEQVRRAPERRIDNMITQLDDSVRLLTMHSVMMDVVRTNYQVRHAHDVC
jgi:hypothetical protein